MKMCLILYANIKSRDQPTQPDNLICLFFVHYMDTSIFCKNMFDYLEAGAQLASLP